MDPVLNKIRETRAYSCLECGKCTGTCPVARYAASFSPRAILIRSLRNSTEQTLHSPDLWSCLTCQQCDTICPSDIKYIELMQLLRESAGGHFDESSCSHGGIIQTISRIMTNETLQQNRLDWLSSDLKTSRDSEYLYFVGCVPYYDPIFLDTGAEPIEIAVSTLRILNYFGINPQLLPNEKCCGHDFFWNGDLTRFRKLAESNIDQFTKQGIKKIITSCPECYRTLKVEYPKYLGSVSYEVHHISEFLEEKLKDKKLSLPSGKQHFTYQDPCRLGRHLGIYEPPRTALTQIKGGAFSEMAHHHKRATCCGVSAWMNCSQVSKQIQEQRLREALNTGADVLVTACPKCQIHLSCAMRNSDIFSEERGFLIKDLTQVVAECLQ